MPSHQNFEMRRPPSWRKIGKIFSQCRLTRRRLRLRAKRPGGRLFKLELAVRAENACRRNRRNAGLLEAIGAFVGVKHKAE